MVLSTAANLALRGGSRVRMAERLVRAGLPPALLNQLFARRSELLLATATVRMSTILMLALMMADVAGIRPVVSPARSYILAFLASIAITLVMGVAIPGAWARYAGDALVAAAVRPLLALRIALFPVVAFLRLFDVLIRRLAGVPHSDEQEAEAEQIEKEILGVVSEAESAGAVHERDAEMIESVIEFRDTQVGEIMTPRTEIVAVPATATLFEVKETIAHDGHSRLPVYGENIDDVKGVLYAKDILQIDDDGRFDPLAIMRKVPFVPETKKVPDLLAELRAKQVHIAIVLDEYGGTAGLVTVEDIVEEIVGEIADEFEARPPETIKRLDDRTLEVDARVHIDELNDELSIDLPDEEDYDTIGGFLFSRLGRIPTTGEEYRHGNVVLRVIEAEERKINRVRVEVQAASPSPSE